MNELNESDPVQTHTLWKESPLLFLHLHKNGPFLFPSIESPVFSSLGLLVISDNRLEEVSLWEWYDYLQKVELETQDYSQSQGGWISAQCWLNMCIPYGCLGGKKSSRLPALLELHFLNTSLCCTSFNVNTHKNVICLYLLIHPIYWNSASTAAVGAVGGLHPGQQSVLLRQLGGNWFFIWSFFPTISHVYFVLTVRGGTVA